LDENCTELAKWMKIVKTGPNFKLSQNCTEAGELNANCTKVTKELPGCTLDESWTIFTYVDHYASKLI